MSCGKGFLEIKGVGELPIFFGLEGDGAMMRRVIQAAKYCYYALGWCGWFGCQFYDFGGIKGCKLCGKGPFTQAVGWKDKGDSGKCGAGSGGEEMCGLMHKGLRGE